jgi:1-acyl-sn-glycerol-3-phosphate acyltransferase
MSMFLSGVWYYLNLAWVKFLLFFITTREITGLENVPKRGAVIVVSNHLNNADPPILTASIPRRLFWLTKIEWFSTPVVGRMFSMAKMIPVRRFEADLKALRMCEKITKQGHALGMFPEGHRSDTGGLITAEPGTALIALRTGAPVLPVAIWGTEKVKLPRDLIGRTHAHIRIGKPFRLARKEKVTREEIAGATDTIMKAIAALLPEKYRGVYGEPGASRLGATPQDPDPQPLSRGRESGDK